MTLLKKLLGVVLCLPVSFALVFTLKQGTESLPVIMFLQVAALVCAINGFKLLTGDKE